MAFVTKTVTIASGTAKSATIYPQDISNNGLLVFCGVYCPSSVDAATTLATFVQSLGLVLAS